MRRQHFFIVMLVLALLVGIVFVESGMDVSAIETFVHTHAFLGGLLYIALLLASVVLLPFSSLPFLPLAANVFGIWVTAVLSILGWWIGCLIAFMIARLGRPYVEKVTSLASIDRLEKKIPPDISFVGIVLLRMVLPVDITSFALGLFKNLSFTLYAVASLVGIIPFAFVWSYAGGEVGKGQFVSAGLIVLGMSIVVVVVRRVWMRERL